MLDQLIDYADQHIAQQTHGDKEKGHIGPAGKIIENVIGHDGQDQPDGADDFDDGIHGSSSYGDVFLIISAGRTICQGIPGKGFLRIDFLKQLRYNG